MKRAIVISVIVAAALGANVWRTAGLRGRAADARPEAVATGGALLALASILRRNLAARVK